MDDLHRWAREACDTLNWDEQRLTVEMDDLLAVCFAIHYPDAATAVHETNERVLYREAVAKTFNESAKMIAAMVPGEAVPECVNFLLWIGERPDDGSADVWEIGDGGAVIVTPAGLGSSYLVAQAQRREDVESTLEAAKRAAALMRNHDASQALRTMADDASVRKRALDTLRDVALDHDPPNECPKCPSLGVVGYQKIDGTPTMPS